MIFSQNILALSQCQPLDMTLSQCQLHEGSLSYILSDSPQKLLALSQCHPRKYDTITVSPSEENITDKTKASDVGNLWHLVIRTKHSGGLRPQIKRANQESDQDAMLAVQTNSAPHQSKLQIAVWPFWLWQFGLLPFWWLLSPEQDS